MIFITILLCIFSFELVKAKELSVGFMIYGDPIPEEALYAFDWLVVDPDSPNTKRVMELFYLQNRRAKLIAYLSVGELEPYREYFKEAPKEWILGRNQAWGSFVADIRRDEYIEFLLKRVAPRLEGFDGFFLDTLDSHQIYLKDPKDIQKARENIINFVKTLRQKYPHKLILINRGFEVMEELRAHADAVVAESLYYGISHDQEKRYIKMKEEDTKWLLSRLNRASELGFRVVVIDYVDPRDAKLKTLAAQQILKHGFTPYVSDRYLRTVGVSTLQLQPRRILMLYSKNSYQDPSFTRLNRFIQPWLEYLGYVPVLMPVEEAISDSRLTYHMSDLYAGMVVDANGFNDADKLYKWLLDKKAEGLKIFFLDSFVFPPENSKLRNFGLRNVGYFRSPNSFRIVSSSFQFQTTNPKLTDMPMIIPERADHYIKVLSRGTEFFPIAVTEWGGYALGGSLLTGIGGHNMFVINPVDLFSKVFKPLEFIPDVTTENGRRLLTVHMDGDAFFGNADFNPSKNLAEIIRDEFIKKYPVPHTISVIEGEIAPHGLYPELSEKLEGLARSIFSLDNVELASHTFSHPFKWQPEALSKVHTQSEPLTPYNLPIKGYSFDLRREIFGSIQYINTRLAPKSKSVKVFLWSGDTNPSQEAIRMTYSAGVYNVNGGYTWINRKDPHWTYISPMGVNKGEYFQVYAPVMNENVYTNLWTDYHGFVRVIDTFEMTDRPLRIKPIGIYFHTYSAQKIASMSALRRVYEWALSQNPNPIYLSEYAQKVLEFRNTAILKHVEHGTVHIRNGGNLRTLRFNGAAHVNISEGKGVVGYLHHGEVTYIHLDPSGDYMLSLGNSEPGFRLISSNGHVISFSRLNGSYSLEIKSYVPLELILSARGCMVKVLSPISERKTQGESIIFLKATGNYANIQAQCKE